MGQWISPGACNSSREYATVRKQRVTIRSLPVPSPASLPSSSILPRYIADHEITRIIYHWEPPPIRSLSVFLLLPSQLPPPPSRHLSRSYCLASAFGIMHNSMARGLRLDAVVLAIGCRSSARWYRWFAIPGRGGWDGRTVFSFVREHLA